MDFLFTLVDKPTWFGLGIVSGLLALLHNGLTTRRRAAAEIMFQSRQDSELRAGFRTVVKLHDATDQDIKSYATEAQQHSDEAAAIRYVINHFEYISVGIQRNIYDERLLKLSIFTTVVRIYKRTKPFIDVSRTEAKGSPTLFQEFEWLACRWKKKPIKIRKTTGVVT